MSLRFASLVATAALAALVVTVAETPARADLATSSGGFHVVLDHVDNPRGLFIGSNGALWVAEAGRGGKACARVRGILLACYGRTGKILRISHGRARAFASGLASIRFARFGTLGADDVSVSPNGSVFTAIVTDEGLLSSRVKRTALKSEPGKLLRLGAVGKPHVQATVAKDTHPYGVLALSGREYVTDSEKNTLIEVRGHRTHVVFHFPAGYKGADSVPTSLAEGPDGAIYIGELSGEEAGPAHARIWRMVPGQKPQVWATGFNSILGLAFGPDGSLYACEFSRNFATNDPHGDVVRIAPDGTRTTIGAGQLFHPGGIAVGSDGTVYVSNWSTLLGKPNRAGHRGQIVALSP
jgi:glucose/arabinose dehydrogenase